MTLPQIIQGGMGIGVSGWRLASAVSRRGGLGVVSGVGIGITLAGHLQRGDVEGNYRRALAAFPSQVVAGRILEQYFIEGGRKPGARYKPTPLPSFTNHVEFDQLNAAASFAEIWLAKQGHSYPIGLNLLTKLQTQTLPSLLGAMLAGVDVVIMGAGIPVRIPGILDQFAKGLTAQLQMDVMSQAPGAVYMLELDPTALLGKPVGKLHRPIFMPIVSSVTLAVMLQRRSNGKVDGFVIESPAAGGHNAPPRGAKVMNERGEVVWGQRDALDPAGIKALGLPFWLAGERGSPEGLASALAVGASGVQVGTAFAFCRESVVRDDIKHDVLALAQEGKLDVRSDPTASPTGFPFKVVQLPGSLSDDQVYRNRPRICEAGYLREPYALPGGGIGWRCAAEPEEQHTAKGGTIELTIGHKCLCSGLAATVGMANIAADGAEEPPIITCGTDVNSIARMIQGYGTDFSAGDVIAMITGRKPGSATITAKQP